MYPLDVHWGGYTSSASKILSRGASNGQADPTWREPYWLAHT